jgi:hypothetical protein
MSVMSVMLCLTGCVWFQTVPLTGAYGEGFRSGCGAREQGSGYEARDADARAHLQGRYWQGDAVSTPVCRRGKKSSKTNGFMGKTKNTAPSIKKSAATAKSRETSNDLAQFFDT